MRQSAFGWALLGILVVLPRVHAFDLETRIRRPIAIEAMDGAVVVANRSSGTLSWVDPERRVVLAEYRVADRIVDMARGGKSGSDVLVLDDARGELRRISGSAESVSVDVVARVSRSATKMIVSADGGRVFVSYRWSREVESLRGDERRRLELPFAPRDLLLLDDERTLMVGDAFGGRVGLVDTRTMSLRATCRIDGHNIRSLALSSDGRQVLIAHQRQHKTLADYEELHWGRMVSNAVHVIGLTDLLRAEDGALVRGWLDKQGGIGRATGDPSSVVAGGDAVTAVAFSGVAEVVLRRGNVAHRLSVGEGPEAMALSGERLFVANRLDDSISVIDVRHAAVLATISLGPQPELSAVQRGEKLFFDARISHDGWISCHSCHTDGHSADLLVDTLGDGDYGAPKRVPSLLGTANTAPWGWTGSVASLEAQVEKSVMTTMHADSPLPKRSVSDLVAFLESLEPPPAPSSRFLPGGAEEARARGRAVFADRGCVDCHTPSRFTSSKTFDVGLGDEKSRRLFNPPSLRGVSHRSRLFHDGRAQSLEEVVGRFRHQLDEPLERAELHALLAYLRSL